MIGNPWNPYRKNFLGEWQQNQRTVPPGAVERFPMGNNNNIGIGGQGIFPGVNITPNPSQQTQGTMQPSWYTPPGADYSVPSYPGEPYPNYSVPPTTPAPGAGGGGGSTPPPGSPTQPSPQPSPPQVDNGWDTYIDQLNSMIGDLSGQKGEQERLAQENVATNTAELANQKQAGERQVNQQQGANLKDLASNIRNLFQSGEVYLGSRGAGDSSAANQYAYAIGKIGTKARGDVLTQANQRMQQIGDIFNSETNRLKSELTSRMGEISDWFNTAQRQIKDQIGQIGMNKATTLSTNIYNQALQAMQTMQAEATNRRAMLESWATSNSKTARELVANMQTIQQMPGYQNINMQPQVGSEGSVSWMPTGAGASTTESYDIYGRPIR